MHPRSEHFRQAKSLRADILGAPDLWIPRREILLEWLNGFLRRAEAPTYHLGETEAADLSALDGFLRTKKVPIASA